MPVSPKELSDQFLAQWALPKIGSQSDKEDRGHVVIVAGSREIPGAALLAVNAALRAGAGKVTLATGDSIALALAIAIPEARVIGLPETKLGGLQAAGVAQVAECLASASAILIGPGMVDTDETCKLVSRVLEGFGDLPLILDALAMDAVFGSSPFKGPVLLTPHAGEMAHLAGSPKDTVQKNPAEAAAMLARTSQALVMLKGSETFLATPQGGMYHHLARLPGLAMSGSGDVLAGAIAGLACRAATLEQAAAWGVVVHALAGRRLSVQRGAIGYLARELPMEIPSVIQAIEMGSKT